MNNVAKHLARALVRTPKSAPQRGLRILPIVMATTLLSACASISPSGRSQLTAPEPVSALYSALDLKLTLSAQTPIANSCVGIQCQVDKGFDRQVERLGARLAEAAYAADPELRTRIPEFHFVVAEKSQGGSSSDASGTIVIYRGVRTAHMQEEALAYLIANEMARVIARHHDEKSAGLMISSLIAHILLGPANLAPMMALLASSTASAIGNNIMENGTRTEKRAEADVIALDLLDRQGWKDADVAESLLDYSYRLDAGPWSTEIRRTAARLGKVAPVELISMAE